MQTTYDPETRTIRIDMMLSEAHIMYDNGLKLWLTPGATAPYWSSHANFTYDKIVATPYDFLEDLGYDAFEDDAQYDDYDEPLCMVVDWIDSAPYLER